MSTQGPNYPWYSSVTGDDLEQGDVIEGCPIFSPPADLQVEEDRPVQFTCQERDLIVMSQTCDLVKGREKLEEVLFCPVYLCSDMDDMTQKQLEDARKGRLPAYHVIGKCELPELQRGVRIVEFRRVYTLPLAFVRGRATKDTRLRLMPPYREHLSQSFARFFMRVGLPVDIPSFS